MVGREERKPTVGDNNNSKTSGGGRGRGASKKGGGRNGNQGGRGGGGRGRGRSRGRGHSGPSGKTNEPKQEGETGGANSNLEVAVEEDVKVLSAQKTQKESHRMAETKTNQNKANNKAKRGDKRDIKSSTPDKKQRKKTDTNAKEPHHGAKTEVPTKTKSSEKSKGGHSRSHSNQQSKYKGKGEPGDDDNPYASLVPPNQPQQTSDINYGKGANIIVLHIAEKPSIAEAIVRGLTKGDVSYAKKVLPVHTFVGPPFPKAPHAKKVTHKVSSVAGHVFSVDFPQQFQSWDSVDPAELFHAPVLRKPCKGSVVKHLQDEAKGVDFIVLWNDCDREGENINFEVLDCTLHLMKSGGSSQFDRVYRAYFSAINPTDIMKAFNALGKPDKNQALSVDARQELDLKIGVAFSRFQTRYFQGRYGDLDSAVLSYGPCQTPTLGFCVQRHIDIDTFKPEPYWTLVLMVRKRGRNLSARWENGRSFNRRKTEDLVEKAMESESPSAKVVNIVIKDKKQGRPIPLNTVNMLKACSKALGIGPHAAMQACERLYLQGYVSYPRTESTAYPKSFDIKGTLQQQANDARWGKYVRSLLQKGHTKARGGVDHGDHPPITPCRYANPAELSGDMARVYDLVVRHFISSISEDAVWRSTKISFEVEGLGEKGKFYLAGKENVSPGFLAILLHKEYGDKEHGDDDDDDDDEEEEQVIPEFRIGEYVPLIQSKVGSGSSNVEVASGGHPVWATLNVAEKMTTAPGYLTESELIGMMERHGIGTDASIPTHIENILKRNYVRLESGRRLIPNKLGMVLVNGYHQIDSGLVLPKVRSDIEGECNKIAKGVMKKDDVVRRAIKLFEEKFLFFVNSIDKMDVLFSSSFAKLEDVGKPFTRCGLSRRYLQFIPGPPPRLYNKFTETVYPLPAGGEIKQWSGRICPVEGCGFELCLYEVGSPGRTFPLCPFCFNSFRWSLGDEEDRDDQGNLDKEDAHKERQIKRTAGKKLVLECPLPDDHPLVKELTVSPDPDGGGVMIIDARFGPKWRLVSTRDATIVYLPKSIEKVTVLEETDNILGCHKMKVEFKPGQSPLTGGESSYTCFFPTDQVLQDQSRVFHGSERTASSGRGGRGRGRGRGGRGRKSRR